MNLTNEVDKVYHLYKLQATHDHLEDEDPYWLLKIYKAAKPEKKEAVYEGIVTLLSDPAICEEIENGSGQERIQDITKILRESRRERLELVKLHKLVMNRTKLRALKPGKR